MDSNDMIPSLAMFTLIAVVLIAVVGYLLFKREAANHHPMDKAGDDTIAMVAGEDAQSPPRTVRSTDQLQASGARSQGGPDLRH